MLHVKAFRPAFAMMPLGWVMPLVGNQPSSRKYVSPSRKNNFCQARFDLLNPVIIIRVIKMSSPVTAARLKSIRAATLVLLDAFPILLQLQLLQIFFTSTSPTTPSISPLFFVSREISLTQVISQDATKSNTRLFTQVTLSSSLPRFSLLSNFAPFPSLFAPFFFLFCPFFLPQILFLCSFPWIPFPFSSELSSSS